MLLETYACCIKRRSEENLELVGLSTIASQHFPVACIGMLDYEPPIASIELFTYKLRNAFCLKLANKLGAAVCSSIQQKRPGKHGNALDDFSSFPFVIRLGLFRGRLGNTDSSLIHSKMCLTTLAPRRPCRNSGRTFALLFGCGRRRIVRESISIPRQIKVHNALFLADVLAIFGRFGGILGS